MFVSDGVLPKPAGIEAAGLNVVSTDSEVPVEGASPKLASVCVLALPSESVNEIEAARSEAAGRPAMEPMNAMARIVREKVVARKSVGHVVRETKGLEAAEDRHGTPSMTDIAYLPKKRI